MKANLFVLAFWPASFVATFLALVISPGQQIKEGQIVLERAPFCDFFVVRSQEYFVYVTDRGGWTVVVAGGNVVSGPLLSAGDQVISVDARARLQVRISGWGRSWADAQRRFEEECDPDATNPFGSGAELVRGPAVG